MDSTAWEPFPAGAEMLPTPQPAYATGDKGTCDVTQAKEVLSKKTENSDRSHKSTEREGYCSLGRVCAVCVWGQGLGGSGSMVITVESVRPRV